MFTLGIHKVLLKSAPVVKFMTLLKHHGWHGMAKKNCRQLRKYSNLQLVLLSADVSYTRKGR